MRKKWFLGLFILLAPFYAACSPAAEVKSSNAKDNETVQIGSTFSLSGGVSAYGIAQSQALDLAFSEINTDGGILDQQVERVEYDILGDNVETVSAVTRLATEEQVPVIIGADISSASKTAIQTAAQVEVPVISPSASADNVTIASDGNTEPYGYRVAFQDSDQGRSLAQFATETLEAEKAVVLGDNSSDHGQGLMDMFEETFPGEIIAYENYQAGQTDFNATLTKLSKLDFDVIFIPGYYEEGGPIIKQAREMGITQPILGASGFGNSALTELAGRKNLKDVYYTTHFSKLNDDPRVEAFITNYTEMWDTEPDHFSALAYDTAYVVKDAIERAGSFDPKVINEALAETKDFDGITGTFSFDEMHNPVKTISIIELQDGEETAVHEVEPE